MIASFPMYDRPQTRGHYAALWDGIRAAYDGPLPVPDHLTPGGDLWDHWTSPDLVLSQTCGLPFRARLADAVTLVGTPNYVLEGCPPGYYNSVAVMRADDPRGLNPSLLRLAYNEALSQSGWAAAASHAGACFAGYVRTGAHIASAEAVAGGLADIAYIDAVTWRMIARWDDVARHLQIVARTLPTPGLALITARGGPAEALAKAVAEAIATLSPAARDATGLQGLIQIPRETYLAQPIPEPPK